MRLYGKFAVEGLGCLRRARRLQRLDVGGGEIFQAEHLAVTALQAVILLGGDHDGALTPIARNGDRLRQGDVLIAADMTPEL